MNLRAMAKINLGLDVVRRRDDGYHEVRMIMQTIRMYDRIELTRKKSQGITIQTNLSYLPNNENNLVYQSAHLLMNEFGITEGLDIKLSKMIPVAAGMAGGSSDAAAVLVGVNRMFRLGLSVEELKKRGVHIGADVPYCLMRGTALAEGIGEQLTGLPPLPPCHILVARPGISVSTKFVYEHLRADEIKDHPDIGGMVTDLQNKDLYSLAAKMGNVLETVTIPAYPVIHEIKQVMCEEGALASLMSGSGPAVFGIFERQEDGTRAKARLKESGLARQLFLTTPFSNQEKEDE